MHHLTKNFKHFNKRINPAPTYEKIASRTHRRITHLIEDKNGPAGDLNIKCILQGSYKRDTAIYTINDVDIVALCNLSHKSTANQKTRNQIFNIIGKSILEDKTNKDKVKFRKRSICIKIELESIKIDILPALKYPGKSMDFEPFYMFKPDEDESKNGVWKQGFAREHQKMITNKNKSTEGNFVPIIKLFKHLRSINSKLTRYDAVSYHIECLLYSLKDSIYSGSISQHIESVLHSLSGFTPEKAQKSNIKSPCGDIKLFNHDEWNLQSFSRFYHELKEWNRIVSDANKQDDRDSAIDKWKELLGNDYFPREPK